MFTRKLHLVSAALMLICAVNAAATDPGEPDTLKLTGGPLVLDVSRALTLTIVNDFNIGGFTTPIMLGTISGGMAQFDSAVYINRLLDTSVFNQRSFYEANSTIIVMGGVNVDFSGTLDLFPLPPGNTPIAHLYFTGLDMGDMFIDSTFYPPAFEFVFATEEGFAYVPQYELFTVSVVDEVPAVCGDANGDGPINVGDAVYLINFVFKSGPPPDPLCVGNANGDASVNVGDAVYLINYVFKNGNPPIEPCCR